MDLVWFLIVGLIGSVERIILIEVAINTCCLWRKNMI